MAVPKKKQSHTRTATRRAQHRISHPDRERVPALPQSAPAHRVCPVCGTYAGREVLAGDEHGHDHDHDH